MLESVPWLGPATMRRPSGPASRSVLLKVIAFAVSSSVTTLWWTATGASLTGLTVSTKVSVAVKPSASVTVKVIVVVPDWLARG